MIRPFTIFCKLNQIPFSDRQWVKQEAESLNHTDGICPVCHAKACLSAFASYTRYLVEWESRTFRYGYLVTTSPQSSDLPSAAPSLRLGHRLRAFPTPMV